MSIEMFNRLSLGTNAVNIEGTDPASPIRELAHGQEGVTVEVDKYLGEKNRIILDKRFSESGTKGEILKTGEATVKEIQRLGVKHSTNALTRLAKLEKGLKITDDDEPTAADMILKIYHWQTLGAMNDPKRFAAASEAFNTGNMSVIRAILDWNESLHKPFIENTIAEWKSQFANARNPLVAAEFAALGGDIEKFRATTELAILKVTEDSGIDKQSLRDRMPSPDDLIRESQLRRTESTDDHLSVKNVRSPHAPNTPVTV